MTDTQPDGEPEVPPAGKLAGSLGALAVLGCVLAVATPSQAAFPGMNGKIAFTSDPTGFDLEIYTMNADGSAQVDISNDPDNSDSSPSWSPDGTKVVFSTDRDGNDEIYVMSADGTGQARLTNTAESETVPAWSPDGQKILFIVDDGTFNLDVYVMDVDGTARTPLTTDPQIDTGAVWSPDGGKIAFTSTRDGNSEIYVMNPDGTGQTNLTNNPATDSAADWAPGGQKIAFTSRRDGNAEVYVMNPDGTGQTRLTNNPASDFSPAFSPDGSRIAFRSNRDGNAEIYVMDTDGLNQTRLTTNSALDIDPDWQPVQTPTAATLLSFAASTAKRGVLLRWRTASEQGTLGYNVFRQERGQRVRTNARLLPVEGTPGTHSYAWLDRAGGRTSRYWLQEVRLDGSHTWYGPAPRR